MTMRRAAIAFVTIAALLASSPIARADAAFDDAVDAFNAGAYTSARDAFGTLAGHGDAGAQFFIGIMHLRGLGGPADIPAARAWLKRAGDGGHAAAQFQLGEMYRSGTGAPAPDRAQAATWYLRAAEAGWFGA
ncbi:MAG: tetratricopeptide repeat protein [Alphaproteobacteria bacterium]|jgi:TPR repeat protein